MLQGGPPEDSRPDPRPGASNIVILDSLRYDTWLSARPRVLERLGPVERRWSYASWTAPSHYNLLMGLLPHKSPTGVYASDYYKLDYRRYAERLGVPGLEFEQLLPSLYLPTFLRNKLGYRTGAMVSMPVLNRHTPISRDFDSYRLMDRHNDMAAMLEGLKFDTDRPSFYLLNVGETHYPYATPEEDPAEWPRIPGLHGVVRQLDQATAGGDPSHPFFSQEQMDQLRQRQVRALGYLDGVFERLFDLLPKNTWVVVTADHGELFGEGGYFGHGPIAHEKVLEVPFVEGRLR